MYKLEKEELKEVLKCCNADEKAIIGLMYTSGMSSKAICNLDYYDFLFSIDEYFKGNATSPFHINEIHEQLRNCENIVGNWILYNEKKDVSYVTFNSPEASHAIMDSIYLRKGISCITPTEPLFVGHTGKRITNAGISRTFKNIADKTGIDVRPKHLRKLFVETLRSAGVSNETIKHFLGHKCDSIYCYSIHIVSLKPVYEQAAENFSFEQVDFKIPLEEYRNMLKSIGIGPI